MATLDSEYDAVKGRRSPSACLREEISSVYGQYFQETTMMAEYSLLQQHGTPGVYVLPSSSSPLMWYGLVFIRSGLYSGAVFKFTISIPTNYPDGGCPRFDFQSGVYHPLVDYYTGELDTKQEFPRWRRDVNYLYNLIAYSRNIFYNIDGSRGTANPEAARLYETDVEAYRDRVRESVSACYESIIQHDDSDPHSIELGQWHTKVMQAARQEIFEPEYKYEHSNSRGLSWVKDNSNISFSKD